MRQRKIVSPLYHYLSLPWSRVENNFKRCCCYFGTTMENSFLGWSESCALRKRSIKFAAGAPSPQMTDMSHVNTWCKCASPICGSTNCILKVRKVWCVTNMSGGKEVQFFKYFLGYWDIPLHCVTNDRFPVDSFGNFDRCHRRKSVRWITDIKL